MKLYDGGVVVICVIIGILFVSYMSKAIIESQIEDRLESISVEKKLSR